MKQIRKRLTYANVMSSLAVFLVIGGATAFAAGQLGKNTVGTKQLKKNAVTTTKIKKNAVTTAKIKNGAVSESKLANGAVTTNKIGDNAVTTPKITDNAVTTGKLADGAVTTNKIGDNAVTTPKITDNAVTTGKLADGAVNGSKVTDGSLTSADLAPGVLPVARNASLKSGETITGMFSIEEEAEGANKFLGTAGSFQILPSTPIPAANRHMITGSSGAGCPGLGQADPGQLCVYQVRNSNGQSPALFDETGSGGPSTYGFTFQIKSVATGVVVYNAVWVYTAP